MSEHVLELSALAPTRQKARIRTEADPDGTLYQLAVPEDFGAVDMRALGNDYAEAEGLIQSDKKLTKAQEKRLDVLMDGLASALILDVPADVVAALPYITKRRLAMSFFVDLGESLLSDMGERGTALLQSTSET